MSAFVLISANAAYKNLEKTQKHRKKSSSRSSEISTSRVSISELSLDKSTRTSIASSTSSSGDSKSQNTSQKKVFDVNKNAYVDRNTLLLPPDRAIIGYERKLNNLTKFKYHALNEGLNGHYVKLSLEEDSHCLFTKKNILVLRYIYFEEFNFDVSYIRRTVSTEGTKLAHINHIAKIRSIKETLGLPLLMDEETNEDIKDEYNMKNIRGVFNSSQFWNNVYQDMKFESQRVGEDEQDHFKILPGISQIKEFFGDIFDYFLYHIDILDIPITSSLEKYASQLRGYQFFYLRDKHYEWFNIMSNVHLRMYRNQSIISNFTTNSKNSEQYPLQPTIELLLKIITDNLKLVFTSRRFNHHERELNNKMFSFWNEFMLFLFKELIVEPKKYITENSTETHDENKSLFTAGYQDEEIILESNYILTTIEHIQSIPPHQSSPRSGFRILDEKANYRNYSVVSSMASSAPSSISIQRHESTPMTDFCVPIQEESPTTTTTSNSNSNSSNGSINDSKPKRLFFGRFKKS